MNPPNKIRCIAFLILCCAPVLQAKAVSLSGYVYGEFSHPLAGCADEYHINNADLGHSSSSSSVFSWGASRHSPYGSQFSFDGASSDAHETDFSVSSGSAFSLGQFTYTNLPTRRSSSVEGIDFRVNINLSGVGWSSFDYSLSIDNTPNNGGNDADHVGLKNRPDDVFFDYAGQSYMLEVLGFSRDSGLTFEDYATVAERSSTTAEIYARVQVVPVPAAVWLFVSGGIALVSITRRSTKV